MNDVTITVGADIDLAVRSFVILALAAPGLGAAIAAVLDLFFGG